MTIGPGDDECMRVVITGSSGLIGSALVRSLRADGHDVVRLVRREPRAPDEVRWDPDLGRLDPAVLDGCDAVVNLAGAGVGDRRWTKQYKRTIRNSRIRSTATIAAATSRAAGPPAVLVSGSAIGYYGDTGERAVTEGDPAGAGFLAEVVRDWEDAALPVHDVGVRLVHLRSGLVVSGRGGAWGRLWPLFRLGLGGRLGPGTQYWSWVSLRDEVRAIRFLIGDASSSGPYNTTAPNPASNADITAAMGRALHRPTMLPVPSVALRLALGEMSQEVLGSARVLPRRLSDAGFAWLDPTIDDALLAALSDRAPG